MQMLSHPVDCLLSKEGDPAQGVTMLAQAWNKVKLIHHKLDIFSFIIQTSRGN